MEHFVVLSYYESGYCEDPNVSSIVAVVSSLDEAKALIPAESYLLERELSCICTPPQKKAEYAYEMCTYCDPGARTVKGMKILRYEDSHSTVMADWYYAR